MKVVICNYCGKKWEPQNSRWGISEENISILKTEGGNDTSVVTTTIDLCEECYEAFKQEILKVNTKYAMPRKRRGRGAKKNENI